MSKMGPPYASQKVRDNLIRLGYFYQDEAGSA
jgi:hypothetical protein